MNDDRYLIAKGVVSPWAPRKSSQSHPVHTEANEQQINQWAREFVETSLYKSVDMKYIDVVEPATCSPLFKRVEKYSKKGQDFYKKKSKKLATKSMKKKIVDEWDASVIADMYHCNVNDLEVMSQPQERKDRDERRKYREQNSEYQKSIKRLKRLLNRPDY